MFNKKVISKQKLSQIVNTAKKCKKTTLKNVERRFQNWRKKFQVKCSQPYVIRWEKAISDWTLRTDILCVQETKWRFLDTQLGNLKSTFMVWKIHETKSFGYHSKIYWKNLLQQSVCKCMYISVDILTQIIAQSRWQKVALWLQ